MKIYSGWLEVSQKWVLGLWAQQEIIFFDHESMDHSIFLLPLLIFIRKLLQSMILFSFWTFIKCRDMLKCLKLIERLINSFGFWLLTRMPQIQITACSMWEIMCSCGTILYSFLCIITLIIHFLLEWITWLQMLILMSVSLCLMSLKVYLLIARFTRLQRFKTFLSIF